MYVGDRRPERALWSVLDGVLVRSVVAERTTLDVRVSLSGVIELDDDGPGMPTDEERGHPLAEHFVSAYFVPGHIGLGVANALSETFELDVFRNGIHWHQSYRRGQAATAFTRVGDTHRSGTRVRLLPDATILDDAELRRGLATEPLEDHLALTPRALFDDPRRLDTTIRFHDERDGSSTTWLPPPLPAPEDVVDLAHFPSSFDRFIEILAADLDRRPERWENVRPADLLEASRAWLADTHLLSGWSEPWDPADPIRVATVLDLVLAGEDPEPDTPLALWRRISKTANSYHGFSSWEMLARSLLAAKYYE